MLHYAASFGTELAIDNIIGDYYLNSFKIPGCIPVKNQAGSCSSLSLQTAGIIGSLFGLMNIVSRGLGGFLSDRLFHMYGVHGRIVAQFVSLTLAGALMFGFGFVQDLVPSIVLLALFSFFLQMANGTAFGIVPHLPFSVGVSTALVGAAGIISGACFSALFKGFADSLWIGFVSMGAAVIALGTIPCLFLDFEGDTLFKRQKNSIKLSMQ
jgi:NNP family nitrate/nitrite transporter-like MFS transporter